MSYLRRVYLLLVVLGIVIALSAGTSIAQTPGGEEPLGEEALNQDAKMYASHFGVDLDEALRRLQLQGTIGGLSTELAEKERDTFAGLWIQHEPEFRVIVAFTRDVEETVQPYVEGKPFADIVEVRTADATLAELKATQEVVYLALRELDIPADLLVDESENRVEVRVTDRAQLDAALQKVGIQLPDHVVVVTVDGLFTPTADIFGGKRLDHPPEMCTSGFSVVDSGGTKGVTTAAHCEDSESYDGVDLPWRGGLYGHQWDVQWNRADHAFTVRNLVWDGTWNRYVYATKHRDDQNEGEYVCKYGESTRSSCGNIQTKYCLPTGGEAPPDATATYILVDAPSAVGDSGGPVFSGNTAYGTLVATSDGNDFIYMAANYITDLGVTVLTN